MKIDGKVIATKILLELKTCVDKLKERSITPHLVIILLNNDPASASYVKQKKLKGEGIGAKTTTIEMPENVNQAQLLSTIEQLNNDNNVHGIIVQRPLPKHIDSNIISLAINPQKDIDGFRPNSQFQPPISLAVLRILESITFEVAKASDLRLLEGGFLNWIKSKKIAVIGKGETGGKPIISVFKKMGINPEVIDSKTPNPEKLTKKADIIISAVGKENVVREGMTKKGVILISVGMHKGKDGKFHGDYNEEKIKNIASFYTPTPGGVGPLNVAMLLKNLVSAAENQTNASSL